MISQHPTSEQLRQFAKGETDAALGLMISAHCDMCHKCMVAVSKMQNEASEQCFSVNADETLPSLYTDMCERIMATPQQHQPLKPRNHGQIELDGRFFELPAPLARWADSVDGWSKLAGKLWQTQMDFGGDLKGHFIFMEKGGKVPEHTHKGTEMTLVIDGQFEDGRGVYENGDFMITDDSIIHMPQSNVDEGCLVFSIVDQPLHFTSGLARLLNPFSHLFFK